MGTPFGPPWGPLLGPLGDPFWAPLGTPFGSPWGTFLDPLRDPFWKDPIHVATRSSYLLSFCGYLRDVAVEVRGFSVSKKKTFALKAIR